MIRTASYYDALAIAEIYRPCVESTAISFELMPPDAAEIQTRMRKVVEGGYPWLVWEEDETVLGYAYAFALRDRAAYDWSAESSIYVASQAHGKGIGRLLYGRLFEILKGMGICQVFAAMTLPNAGSEGLHRACGFKPIGVWPDAGFKFEQWHDVGWWVLDLQDRAVPPPVRLRFDELTN